jgi:hypothetical protein
MLCLGERNGKRIYVRENGGQEMKAESVINESKEGVKQEDMKEFIPV